MNSRAWELTWTSTVTCNQGGFRRRRPRLLVVMIPCCLYTKECTPTTRNVGVLTSEQLDHRHRANVASSIRLIQTRQMCDNSRRCCCIAISGRISAVPLRLARDPVGPSFCLTLPFSITTSEVLTSPVLLPGSIEYLLLWTPAHDFPGPAATDHPSTLAVRFPPKMSMFCGEDLEISAALPGTVAHRRP